MIKRSFTRIGLNFAIISLLAACTSDKDLPYVPKYCTPAMIIGELSESQMNDPKGKILFSTALTNVVVKCEESKSEEEIALYVRMLLKKAMPAAEEEIHQIPYFVVLAKGDTLILKEKLEAEVTFRKNQKRITPTISSRIKIPLQKGASVLDYTLYVGLQITENQLDKNYQKREQLPNFQNTPFKRPTLVKK